MIIEQLKELGTIVNYPEHDLFKNATKRVREHYSADYADIYREAVKLLESLS